MLYENFCGQFLWAFMRSCESCEEVVRKKKWLMIMLVDAQCWDMVGPECLEECLEWS